MRKKKAFTLAEVLITLTIIGVIAALTIPNLMQKWEEQHTVSAVKEAYSLLDNATKQLIREKGTLNEWAWPKDKTSAEYLTEELKNYIKIEKHCHATDSKCFSPKYRNLQNTKDATHYIMQTNYSSTEFGTLANGMDIVINRFTGSSISNNNSYVTAILVDINGNKKGPNRYGYDAFIFSLGANGMTSKALFGNLTTFPSCCNILKDNYNSGASCAGWIMLHGNTDYKTKETTKGLNWDSPWL